MDRLTVTIASLNRKIFQKHAECQIQTLCKTQKSHSDLAAPSDFYEITCLTDFKISHKAESLWLLTILTILCTKAVVKQVIKGAFT